VGAVEPNLLADAAEQALHSAVADSAKVDALLRQEDFAGAMQKLGLLRRPLDGFFDAVTVNAEDAALRRNRLRLLSMVRVSMNSVADFTQIESL
jgi:glycyl-tRNA synthetase beta chain